jgi:hypothetical protein
MVDKNVLTNLNINNLTDLVLIIDNLNNIMINWNIIDIKDKNPINNIVDKNYINNIVDNITFLYKNNKNINNVGGNILGNNLEKTFGNVVKQVTNNLVPFSSVLPKYLTNHIAKELIRNTQAGKAFNEVEKTFTNLKDGVTNAKNYVEESVKKLNKSPIVTNFKNRVKE